MKNIFFLFLIAIIFFSCKKEEFPNNNTIKNDIQIDTSGCNPYQKNILGYWNLTKIQYSIFTKDSLGYYSIPYSSYTQTKDGFLVFLNKSTYHTSSVTSGAYQFVHGQKDTIRWNNPFGGVYGTLNNPANKLSVEYSSNISLILGAETKDSEKLMQQTLFYTIK